MKKIIILILIINAGCATRSPLYSKNHLAKVVNVEESHSYNNNQSMVLPVGNNRHIMNKTKSITEVFVYTLELSNGKIIKTSNNKKFTEDDCVIFWHSPLAVNSDPSYNVTVGEIEKSSNCP